MINIHKYPTYKPSSVNWLGEIPEHWELKPGFTIIEERNEKNTGLKENTVLSLSYGNVIIKPEEKLTGLVPESFETYQLVYPGDIIIRPTDLQNDKTSLRTGLAKDKGIITSAYINLKVKNGYLTSYIHYFLHAVDITKVIYGLGTGLRQNLSYGEFKRFKFPIPKVEEQTAIATFLDHKTNLIDKAIAIKEKQIELLKERRQILIHNAVTRGLNPNVKLKDSGVEWIGEVPEHWEVKPLRFVGVTQNGISKGGDYFGTGFPFVSYGDVYRDITLPEQVNGLAESSIEDRKQYSVIEGDVFFTRTSETIEEIGFASTCLKTIKNATFAGFLIRFRPQRGLLIPNFSKYYFSSKIHRAFFVKEMNLVIRASLSQDLLKQMPVLLPPIEEQRTIANYLDNVSKKIFTAITLKEQEIEKLKEYKATLINSAVTGKIKVCTL